MGIVMPHFYRNWELEDFSGTSSGVVAAFAARVAAAPDACPIPMTIDLGVAGRGLSSNGASGFLV